MNKLRQDKIKEFIEDQKVVTIKQLQNLFPDVSLMTIHRDLDVLARCGAIIKVRGGARSMKFITTSLEESFNLRLHANSAAKVVEYFRTHVHFFVKKLFILFEFKIYLRLVFSSLK